MQTISIPVGLRQVIVGSLSAAVAFFATLGLSTLFDEHFFTLMVAAVAYSCWRVNWKAGAICTFIGIFGVVLLLPPKMHFSIAGASDIVRLIMFMFTGSMVCLLSYFKDRTTAKLQVQRDRTAHTEELLQVAAQENKLWTWEYDPDRNLLSWQMLATDNKLRWVMPFESWLRRLHPADRESVKNILQMTTGNIRFRLEYRVQTSKGIHWWSSRGVVLKQYGPGTRKYIGISTDINLQKAIAPTAVGVGETDKPPLNMVSFIEINSLIHEVLEGTSIHASYRSRLTKAIDKIEMVMVSEMSANAKK